MRGYCAGGLAAPFPLFRGVLLSAAQLLHSTIDHCKGKMKGSPCHGKNAVSQRARPSSSVQLIRSLSSFGYSLGAEVSTWLNYARNAPRWLNSAAPSTR